MNVSTVNRLAIYFDTTVLLDVIDNRRESTHMLLETAREHGFQITTALYFGCQLIVSSDSDLLRTARQYIHATPPEGFRNAIANLT